MRLLTSCLEGTASKPPKQDNCATKRHAPFSFSLEPKQVGKPKMSITDMTGHMECMVVSECLWDDCILSTKEGAFAGKPHPTSSSSVVSS